MTPPEKDHELRRLERRLNTAPRQRVFAAAVKFAWRVTCASGRVTKRLIDIAVAAAALLLLSPLLLAVAIAIRLHDGGPVLYWQTRIGKWGRPFPFPKFRSMVANADALRRDLESINMHGGGVTFKMKRDPRVTPVGRLIRRSSIDELPQLWCVLRGDMSLVGPRPALASEVERYNLGDRRRLDATPGLTCTWQVSGRSDIPFPEQLRLDVDYIHRQSLAHDLGLLLRTVPAVLSGRGAY